MEDDDFIRQIVVLEKEITLRKMFKPYDDVEINIKLRCNNKNRTKHENKAEGSGEERQ